MCCNRHGPRGAVHGSLLAGLFAALLLLFGAWAAWRALLPALAADDGIRIEVRAKTVRPLSAWERDRIALVLRRRYDRLSGGNARVVDGAGGSFVVELPGFFDAKTARAMAAPGMLEFRYVPELDDGTWVTHEEMDAGGNLTGFEQIIDSEGRPVPAKVLQERVFGKPPILSGADFMPNARVETRQNTRPDIRFEFEAGKKQVFEHYTRAHIGKRIAIFLDQRLITAPIINEAIPGAGMLEGRFTPEQARTLVDQLNAGALPAPLEIVALRVVKGRR